MNKYYTRACNFYYGETSKANIQNRPQRDFFEKKNLIKRKKFIKYLKNSGIYFPGNGIISLSYSLNRKQVEYTFQKLSKGLKIFFNSSK